MQTIKENPLAAFLVFGSFALLGCAPFVGALILWHASPHEPLVGYYLVLAAPLGMLGWAVIRKNAWDHCESKLLSGWSRLNTVLLFVDLCALFGVFLYSCALGLTHMFPAAYDRLQM